MRPGTQSGQVIPLYDQRVHHLRATGRGDLQVHVEVHTPTKLDGSRSSCCASSRPRDEEHPTGTVQTGNASSGGLFSRLRDAFNS